MSNFQANQENTDLYGNFLVLCQKFDSADQYVSNYIAFPTSNKGVFLQSAPTSTIIAIEPKQLSKNNGLQSVLFFSVMFSLLIISIILVGYIKYLKVLIQSLFYDFIAEKTINDFSVPLVRVSRMLDLLSIFSSILIFYGISQFFKINMLTSLLLLFLPAVILIMYRIWLWIFHKALLISTYKSNQILHLNYVNNLIIRILMLFLIPLSLAISYTVKPINGLFVYISISLIAITIMYRYATILRIFIKQRVSLLYFILYLCTLEMPIILGVTYLMRVS